LIKSRIQQEKVAVECKATHLAGFLADLVLVRASRAQLGLRAASGAVRTSGAKSAIAERTGAGGTIIIGQAGTRGVNGTIVRTVEATRACRTICHIDQTCRRRICAGRALNRSVASHRAVVTGRAYVVDRGVLRLHAGLTNVADLEARLATLVGSGDRAATATEVALAALGGGLGEASRPTVVARRALRALGDILEAVAVAVGAIGTQELGGEAGPRRAVAAWRAMSGVRGVLQAIGSRWACLNGSV
jgi:hypothetical protein